MDRFAFICLLLCIYVDYASSIERNITLVTTSNDVVAGTSVTLACTAFGIDEIKWNGPSGQITYFSGCNELSEFNGPDVDRFRITCSFEIGSRYGTVSNLTIISFDPGRDQGSWGCFDGTAQAADAYISLTSQEVGIKNIHITSTPGSVTATNELTLLEKESDTLTCTAECNSTCQYKWMKGTELVASTSQLSLNNITSTASGQYICHASYNDVELTKSLRVSVLQRDYVIFDPPGDLITVAEGQTISINCSAENGMCDQNEYRRCVNCWDNHSNTAGTCKHLVIPNATPSMAGLYRCHYTEEEPGINALWSTFKTLEVRVLAGPSSIVIYPNVDVITLTPGSTVTLNCSAECQLECNYSWKSVSDPTVIISTTAALTISNISSYQQDQYICTASNVGGNLTGMIYVEVWENYFDESANSSLVTSNTNPAPGSSVTLTCSVKRSATGGSQEEVDWYGPHGVVAVFKWCYRLTSLDGPNITDYTIDCIDGSTTGDGWTTSTLTIHNYIPERDAGNWSCLDDTIGPSLKVISPDGPSSVIITPTSDPVTITNGESLSLVCSADCQPDCNFTWTYNNVIVSTTATYTINSITNSQNGIYTCTVTNVIGSAIKSTKVAVNCKFLS
ncbi:basement membrane-specific heparan sulfate proteoglycan core protein [Patella vulgata]|uniref:basement membrane-specific heparan sulfate proteoglycan core protein n=1 Tax=Patella vulgata TaxID=6465 RepID=UPI0024A805FD|nr:basement membrane-specific heparan sulfate proteoglycan core protein [Patella vulgata]